MQSLLNTENQNVLYMVIHKAKQIMVGNSKYCFHSYIQIPLLKEVYQTYHRVFSLHYLLACTND